MKRSQVCTLYLLLYIEPDSYLVSQQRIDIILIYLRGGSTILTVSGPWLKNVIHWIRMLPDLGSNTNLDNAIKCL